MSIPDTWSSRDLPVLEATVAAFDSLLEDQGPYGVVRVADIAKRAGVSPEIVLASLRAMQDEYVLFQETGGGAIDTVRIDGVTPDARRAVGSWPTPESLAEKLVVALQEAADDEPDSDRKRKIVALLQGLGGIGQEVLIRVMTEVITGHAPLEVQREIVAEIEGYQKVIDGARAVVENYIVFGDHTCCVKLADRPFVQGADGIKILRTRAELDPGYLYHTLRHRPLESHGYQRHFSLLKLMQIPLPSHTPDPSRITHPLSLRDIPCPFQHRNLCR